MKTLITGFPRIGKNRELKKSLESYWAGKIPFKELQNVAKGLRREHWILQKEKGIDLISSNDFSFYDNMLDTAIMLNAVPERFRGIEKKEDRYFAMARGTGGITAMEMTKWFNTNYHYIVPELDDGIFFRLDASKIVSEYEEAGDLGIKTKINLIGPLTFLGLSKTLNGRDPYDYYEGILPVYKELLLRISELDDSVYLQIDEPIFVKDPRNRQLELLKRTYDEFTSISNNLKIIVTSYFEHAKEAVEVLSDIPLWGVGLDFVHGAENLEVLKYIGNKRLVAGLVNGRNIWINNFKDTLELMEKISREISKDRIIVSTSCSLLHTPFSLSGEPESRLSQWLAFCSEKVDEVALLGEIFHADEASVRENPHIEENSRLLEEKARSGIIHDRETADRLSNLSKTEREGSFEERIRMQKKILDLPPIPTTTIGSFPQTPELRKTRRDFKKGRISASEYEGFIKKYIDDAVSVQEEIGLDVLVHGEPERNDMVEYFGEMLDGFHFTQNAWVQSYGSRCVKPPIIYGDVKRPEPMTVKWINYAQSKTEKIMKGMLTGPVTILNWSFVRDDMPRSEVSKQIALALSDEINDLQKSGIKIIQIDEAAFKEGYPLRKKNIPAYEAWAVNNFKISVSTADRETQIHTHMCYSEFNDIIKTIEAMDADVITIETARSGNELLDIFKTVGYSNEIGPGVYDIHSPRIPDVEEFIMQIKTRLEVLSYGKMWVNPDCGLKTRKWKEVKPALTNMVQAVLKVRRDLPL